MSEIHLISLRYSVFVRIVSFHTTSEVAFRKRDRRRLDHTVLNLLLAKGNYSSV